MKLAIIVPARLGSTRFQEKLLHSVRGKPILLWTAERIRAEAPEYPLYFAVDDERFVEILEPEGFRTVLTSKDHPSGTDRIAEANRAIGAEIVLNVQGDEPLVRGEQIRALAGLMTEGVGMGTLAQPFRDNAAFHDPNRVKVVLDQEGYALYFSRSPIPYLRDSRGEFRRPGEAGINPLLHLGLYAYRADLLESFSTWPPTPLEEAERLEMLRVMERGLRIAVGVTDYRMIAIDTAEDAAEFERHLQDENSL